MQPDNHYLRIFTGVWCLRYSIVHMNIIHYMRYLWRVKNNMRQFIVLTEVVDAYANTKRRHQNRLQASAQYWFCKLRFIDEPCLSTVSIPDNLAVLWHPHAVLLMRSPHLKSSKVKTLKQPCPSRCLWWWRGQRSDNFFPWLLCLFQE